MLAAFSQRKKWGAFFNRNTLEAKDVHGTIIDRHIFLRQIHKTGTAKMLKPCLNALKYTERVIYIALERPLPVTISTLLSKFVEAREWRQRMDDVSQTRIEGEEKVLRKKEQKKSIIPNMCIRNKLKIANRCTLH